MHLRPYRASPWSCGRARLGWVRGSFLPVSYSHRPSWVQDDPKFRSSFWLRSKYCLHLWLLVFSLSFLCNQPVPEVNCQRQALDGAIPSLPTTYRLQGSGLHPAYYFHVHHSLRSDPSDRTQWTVTLVPSASWHGFSYMYHISFLFVSRYLIQNNMFMRPQGRLLQEKQGHTLQS